MNAPTKKTKAMLIATLLLGLGASALAGGAALPSTPSPATSSPATPIQPTAPQTAAPGVTPQAPPAPLVPGQAGPGAARCAPGADMVMRPAPAGPGTTERARPAPPALGTAMPSTAQPTPGTISAQPAAPKAPKGDRMDKGLGKGDQGGKGEVCPPAPRGMERGQPQPGAAASGLATPNQAAPNPAPAARDLNRLDALAAQTSDARIRGYLNDARTYIQSASKAQQKAGRDAPRCGGPDQGRAGSAALTGQPGVTALP